MKRRTFSAAGAAAGLALLAGLLVPAGPAAAAVNDPYSQAIVASGPVSYWRLGDSGPTAVDELAANPGTLNGGVTTGQPGAIGGSSDTAMTFDGINDYVALGSNSSLQPQQFTVETWFKAPVQPASFTFLARWRTFGWSLVLTGTGNVAGAVYGTSGTQYVVVSPNRYDDGQWHHLALAHDATTLSLYLDGVAVATAAMQEATRYDSGGAAIGRDGNVNGSYFRGSLDELALYARPLSLQEAITHYCLGGGTRAVCNHAPSASAGANQSVPEGGTATLDGSASSDPDGDGLTYAWQVLSTTGPSVTLTGPTTAQPSFPAVDDGVNQFRLTVDDGLASATADTTVTVTNVPPAATLTTGPGASGNTSATATFTDPGTLDTHTVAFDWGDGTTADVVSAPGTGSGSTTVEHHYTGDGTYAVAATVVDDDGGQGTATASVTIETAPTGGGTPPPAPRLPNASLWSDGRGDGALDVRGFDIKVAGPVHSNGGAYLFGGWLRLLGGTEYATKFGVFGKSNMVSPQAVRTTPGTGDWADVADYRPGSTAATNAGAAYFDVSSRCRYGVWRPTTPLPAGLYYANCRVELVGSFVPSRVTIAAEGTIDLWLRRGARVQPFVDGVSLVSGARRWDALSVWGADAEVDGALVARAGSVNVFGHALDFGCTLLGANVTVIGDSMTFDAPTCS